MKKWEIQIGQAIELVDFKKVPHITHQISEEQLEIIEMFASTRKDENMNTIYTLNKVDFTIVPLFIKDNYLDASFFDLTHTYRSGDKVLFEESCYKLNYGVDGKIIFSTGIYPTDIKSSWHPL